MEAQEASRDNRNRVLHVVDARERRDMSVDVVCECLISDLFREVSGRDRRHDIGETYPGQTVRHGREGDAAREVKREIDGVDQ